MQFLGGDETIIVSVKNKEGILEGHRWWLRMLVSVMEHDPYVRNLYQCSTISPSSSSLLTQLLPPSRGACKGFTTCVKVFFPFFSSVNPSSTSGPCVALFHFMFRCLLLLTSIAWFFSRPVAHVLLLWLALPDPSILLAASPETHPWSSPARLLLCREASIKQQLFTLTLDCLFFLSHHILD